MAYRSVILELKIFMQKQNMSRYLPRDPVIKTKYSIAKSFRCIDILNAKELYLRVVKLDEKTTHDTYRLYLALTMYFAL